MALVVVVEYAYKVSVIDVDLTVDDHFSDDVHRLLQQVARYRPARLFSLHGEC